MTSKQPQQLAQAKAFYETGQRAFECGNYREAVVALEEGTRLAGGATPLGGNIQLWLMNAYSAANRQQEAIALGEKLVKHPDTEVRKQSKRIVEILKAPKLKRRADWLTNIPDLSDLDPGGADNSSLSKYSTTKRTSKAKVSPEPKLEDLTQINTRENGFVWLALGATLISLGGLWLFR